MRQAALRIFSGALRLDHQLSAPARAYLAARGISAVAGCVDLRFRADCVHPEGGWLPALVALVRNVAGEPVGVHRTYLRQDGSGKAAVEPDKATLGPVWGGAVRLSEPIPGERLAIGEGIESSASAGVLLGAPAWAALFAGNLAAGLELPPEVRHVVIAADHDLQTRQGKRPGQEAADAAARRWRARGRRVEIALPRRPGSDFNDLLLRGEPDAA